MTEADTSDTEVPVGWARSTAGEVCEKIQDGTHFSPKDQLSEGEFPYVTAKNVRPQGLDLSHLTFLREEDHKEIYRRCDPRYGDVLLVKDGVNTGDVAINTLHGEISLLSSVCMMRPTQDLVAPGFLRYYLQSPQGSRWLTGRMSGTAIRRIILRRIKETPIVFPHPNQQRRIVAELESHLTRLDDAVAGLERVQRNLKRYRASVLKAAVEGRLVPTEAELACAEGRDYEPASVLLERIVAERRRQWEEAELDGLRIAGKTGKDERWKAKYPEPESPATSGLGALPEGWCWASLEQLGLIASGNTPRGIEAKLREAGEIPWFRVGDMNTEGNEVFMHVSRTWLSRRDAGALGLHVRPCGTIIFPKRGGAIATNKKRRLTQDSVYDLNTMGLVPVAEDASYIWAWFQQLDLSQLSDGSNVPQINHGDIAPLIVGLPPAAEQVRIVSEVERLLSVTDGAGQAATSALQRLSGLRQSILKLAFDGKLVDQDSSDEPAEVLLERIRKVRETAVDEPRTARGRGRRRARA